MQDQSRINTRKSQSFTFKRFAVKMLIAVIVLVTACNDAFSSDKLQQSFTSPPPSARPWVYWFWVNGNITKEGITADLEAMQKVGVGGALIMHVGAGIPAGPVKFFSDEWRDLFKYAVSEADRLGLEITMNACDGWTGTGGPWIKPEEAMMHLTWTETLVEGPSSAPLTLRKPKSKFNVYHDVAVLAFPVPQAEAHLQSPRPTVTSAENKANLSELTDGKLENAVSIGSAKGQTWILFEFEKPFTARGVRFNFPTGSSKGMPLSGTIENSKDGKNFSKICELNLKQISDIYSITVSFDETTSRYFRIVLPPTKSLMSEITFTGGGRINNWEIKAGFARRWGHGADMPYFAMHKSGVSGNASLSDPSWADEQDNFAIDPACIQNLTKNLSSSDRLDWQVPNGKWILLRVGYTPTGEKNGPASIEGTGLEPDALNPNGIDIAFSRFMAKLLNDVGPLAGKALRYSHIDSWETGSQNWTADFQKEFQKRRGYDITPYLPVMAGGHIVDSVSVSERFLWDVRRTIADMLADYYYGRMSEVCHQNGIGFQTEAAGAGQFLFDPITFQSRSDLPMGEFWVTEGRIRPDCKAAASAAHIFGKQFVGAEAFTSAPSTSRWSEHPYSLKALGDEAFCVGINRYVFHRYAMQPWLDVKPGMTMGPWGIHFERTNTWWDQGSSWMSYIARCQSLLQQGLFVGDVLYFSGEGAPNHIFGDRAEMNPALPYGYDFDACNANVLLNMTSVKDGKLVISNGQRYSVLLLADEHAMSPRLLTKIHELVKEGAVVVGPKPSSSPSLSGYPNCDKEVNDIADILWGGGKAAKVNRKVGKGRVFWGLPLQQIFAKISVPADFEHSLSQKSLRYIHRRNEEADWYFVSNQAHAPVETTCAFRCAGQPELWNPETGAITKPAAYRFENGRTLLPLRLEPAGSAFVVFRTNASSGSLASVNRDGTEVIKTKLTDKPAEKNLRTAAGLEFGRKPVILYPEIKNSFTIAFWTKPLTAIDLPKPSDTQADAIAEKEGQQFVLYPEQGEIAYGNGHASAGISVGNNGICVFEHTSSYFPARLVHKIDISDWAHVALVYNQNSPAVYINGIKVASANKSKYIVHPCGTTQIPGNNAVAVHGLEIVANALSSKEIASLANSSKPQSDAPAIEILQNEDRTLKAVIWQSGKYSAISTNGTEIQIGKADIAEPIQVQGPWEIRFSGMGTPESTTFDKLKSWTESDQPAIKYYSGTAAYVNTIDLPSTAFDKNRKLYLDLGNVQVIAEVKINNKDLGILWKPPFRIDATNALHAGSNDIEIQVTNQWTNRLIGDEQFPPDCKYDNGRLVQWPQWFLNAQARPQPQRLTFATWKHYDKQSHLSESGLLGPVVIRSVMVVELPAPQD